MSDLVGNHIVGFPTRRLNYFNFPKSCVRLTVSQTMPNLLYNISKKKKIIKFIGKFPKWRKRTQIELVLTLILRYMYVLKNVKILAAGIIDLTAIICKES